MDFYKQTFSPIFQEVISSTINQNCSSQEHKV